MVEKEFLAHRRVLVVDDSYSARQFLSRLLTSAGATVVEAENGEQGLAAWQSQGPFDLILLDLILPDRDGIQVLQQIREQDQQATVVIITGQGGVRSAVAAVQFGADGYIEKHTLAVGDQYVEFFYQLSTAMKLRAGLVAQAQLERVRRDFYAMITHDLRNPAGAILQILRLALKGDLGPMTAEMREMLELAADAAQRQMALINDFLDYEKIGAGMLRLHWSEVVLQEVVQKALPISQAQARLREQRLQVELPDAPLRLRGDFDRLVQVVDNLLANAIKYTPRGGQITLRLYPDPAARQAVIEVSDTGLGIDPEHLPYLFTRYQRIPGTDRRAISGTGLGLLIVKEVVEAHGGTVSAASAGRGQGSTFTVRLPLPPAPTEEAA